MRRSSGNSVWIGGFSALKHGPHCGAASACEGDAGLDLAVSLTALAAVEVPGERVICGDGAEGALAGDAPERRVAAMSASAAPARAGRALIWGEAR